MVYQMEILFHLENSKKKACSQLSTFVTNSEISIFIKVQNTETTFASLVHVKANYIYTHEKAERNVRNK